MKRFLMGVLWSWLLVSLLVFFGSCSSVYIQRTMGIPRENTYTPNWVANLALILGIALAILGTVSGKLPGTKKRSV